MGRNDIRFLAMDVDGTLTDGKIYVGNDGELFKAFDVKDGCGIKEILPQIGIIPVIITARQSRILERRCEELDITELHQKEREKLLCLQSILAKWSDRDGQQYTLRNVAYIGDDILDLQCMKSVKAQGGLTACPADAAEQVKEVVDYKCEAAGGNGAVRELIEFLLEKKRKAF